MKILFACVRMEVIDILTLPPLQDVAKLSS